MSFECMVAVGVILGAIAALLCAHYDRWHNPQHYSHLELKQ